MLIDKGLYVRDFGDELPLNKFFVKAHNTLISHTYGNLVETSPDVWSVYGVELNECEILLLKMAVCAIAELEMKLDKLISQNISTSTDGRQIKSISSGGESITYDTMSSVYAEAIADKTGEAKAKLIRQTIYEYAPPSSFRVNPFYAGGR